MKSIALEISDASALIILVTFRLFLQWNLGIS